MIELRPIYYFSIAFQTPSFHAAAAVLGIAVSTLSESVKSIEEELGVALFERAGRGVVPTEAAYWLFRETFNILNAEEFAIRFTRTGNRPIRRISIVLDPAFSAGHLPEAITRAVRATALHTPEVFFHAEWTSKRPLSDRAAGSDHDPSIEIFYREPGSRGRDGHDHHVIGADALVLAGRFALVDGPTTAVEQIVVPVIPGVRTSSVLTGLKKRNGLKRARSIYPETLQSALQSLQTNTPNPPFLAPERSLSGRFSPVRAFAQSLEPPFRLDLVARLRGSDPVALTFLGELRKALDGPQPATTCEPQITARQLQYFRLVQETGSIRQCASVAGVAQTAVSAQLSKLQNCLGQSLFERKHRLRFTDAGRRFSEAAAFLDTSSRKLAFGPGRTKGSSGGRVELGILPSIGPDSFLVAKVTQAVEAWRLAHPNVHLRISEEPNDKLRARIRRGTLNLAVVAIKSPDLARFDVGLSEPLALVYGARSNFAPIGDTISFDAVASVPLVLPTKQFGLRQLVDAAARSREISLRPLIEVESLSMCVAMARGGQLATILPPLDIQGAARAGELCFSIIEKPRIVRTLQVIYSSDRELTPQERDLVALLRRYLKDDGPSFPPETDLGE